MPSDSNRNARAGDYISGLMSDTERERAERDLEIDPAFRDAVIRMAERMRIFDRTSSGNDHLDDSWKLIAARIAELPQMQPMVVGGNSAAPLAPGGNQGEPCRHAALRPMFARRTALILAGVMLALAIGYLTARTG